MADFSSMGWPWTTDDERDVVECFAVDDVVGRKRTRAEPPPFACWPPYHAVLSCWGSIYHAPWRTISWGDVAQTPLKRPKGPLGNV